ncbi:hypothetical protein LCGC14_2766800 [marine sediment metagenome]|uniref:Uncharacterized protein n=1 Tax=marine sediment metagenome TaxID=412755 RepID=A0A0F8ZJ63_9ZZZZ
METKKRIIKEMHDLLMGFKHNVNVLKDEGKTELLVSKVSEVTESVTKET